MFVDRHNTGMHSICLEDNSSEIRDVPKKTLEDVISENHIEQIDFLKIDAEGAEYEILYGCDDRIFARIARIALEFHHIDDDRSNGRELKSFLEGKGFVVTSRQFPCSVIGFLYAKRPLKQNL